MSTRDDLAALVRGNLDDLGVTFWTATDINDAIQDGYDDVAVVSGCIQKSATVNFEDNLSYYNFAVLISDYFAPVAIYNNNTKRWFGTENRKSMATLRRDWELIVGNPELFFPIDSRRCFLGPRMVTGSGNMTVFYRAQAPTLSGSTVPLVHADETKLLVDYATADMLDQQEEFIKAERFWTDYFVGLKKYKSRIGKLAQTDYLPTLQRK